MEEKYWNNVRELKRAVEEDVFIRNVRYHRLADGSLDVDGNLKLWNKGMEPFEKTQLWAEGAPGYEKNKDPRQDEPYLVFIPADKADADTILIAHGGGFNWRTGSEGPNIAEAFHDLGYNTAILSYRLAPAYSRFDDIADMQRAIRLLRSKENSWNLGKRVYVMGFSAGGMICGNCATHFDTGKKDADDPIERFSCRPDAAVLAYGAFTDVSVIHPFGILPDDGMNFGKTAAERLFLAPEKCISADTPPIFIWQTASDDGRLGMVLAGALQEAGIPYELHIFSGGTHGLGLADGKNDLTLKLPHIGHWVELCDEWLKAQGAEQEKNDRKRDDQ